MAILTFIFTFLFLWIPDAYAINSNYNFHKVTAKNGDGIYSLLRRYKLDNHHCNVRKFYDLNKMGPEDYLIEGKKYVLPVYIYSYNNKSIRSSVGINNWESAVRIKEYNVQLLSDNLRNSHYTESKILWVPHHEIFCKSDLAHEPVVANSNKTGKNFNSIDLFGEKYAEIEIVDFSLKDQVYYIVSGHGGPDPGARCTNCASTLCEDEYAYDVSLRLARNLMQHGAKVEIIVQDKNDGIRDAKVLKCDKDEVYAGGTKIQLSQVKRLRDRANTVNKLYNKYKKLGYKDQRAVMIHVDSRSSKKRQDVFFYYFKNSIKSQKMANNLHTTFKSKYDKHQKNRGYKGYVKDRSGLFMLRNTLPPAVYIELANIRNVFDHKRLLLESNRQALANWIFQGIIKA